MKRKSVLLVLSILALSFSLNSGQERPILAALTSGKLTFVEAQVISDSSLPSEAILEAPVSIALHASGRVYVCDGKASNIKVFDADGKFLRTIGRQGQGPGEFKWPSMVHASANNLMVWERTSRRMSVLNLAGRFLKSLPFSQDVEGFPMKMRTLPTGENVIETEKAIDADVRNPQECLISLYSSNMEFVKMLYAKPLFRFKRIYDPGMAEVHQPYNPRVYWDMSPDGKIVIGFAETYEIAVYDPAKGKLFSFRHEYSPVRVTDEDKQGYFSAMTVAVLAADGTRTTRKGAPDYIVKNTTFPKFKPAFNGIVVDSEGNIWIHPYQINREAEKRFFDAFAKDGTFIGRVEIQSPAEFPYTGTAMKRGYFWKIERDKDEVSRLVKYEIH